MMFGTSSSNPIARSILAAAAHWHVELRCGSADPAALQAWRDASAEHERAWDLLQRLSLIHI